MSEKRNLWGDTIPYNSNKSKYNDLCLTKVPKVIVALNFAKWVFGKKLQKDNHGHDDFTDRYQIQKGLVKDTYEDVPVITPFIVKDSKTTVIIAPGGGFCMRDDEGEGNKVAKMLNDRGISAFVVAYRLQPYRFPIPCLDMQRAVRWVRAHADEYGVPKDSVGLMGFSAGGFAAAGSAVFLGNDPVAADGYTEDEIDKENGMPDYLCPIYPVVNFDKNPCMLANIKGSEFYTGANKRKQWKIDYALDKKHNEKAADIPTFLAYGTKDMLGGFEDYKTTLSKNLKNKVLVLDGASHAFATSEKYLYWCDECCNWIHQII